VRLNGSHLDRVDRVFLGNRKVQGFLAGPGGTSLSFALPATGPVAAVTVPITLGWPPATTGEGRGRLASGLVFTLLPTRAASHLGPGPAAPSFSGKSIFQSGATGEYRLFLVGRNLDAVLDLSIAGVPATIRRTRENALDCRWPGGPDLPDPVSSRYTLGYRGGPFDFPERLEKTWESLEQVTESDAPPEAPARPRQAAADSGPEAAGPEAPLEVRIGAMYVTQAVQRRDGSVPMVAGRRAFLRVFLVANRTNRANPTVRVTLFDRDHEVKAQELLSSSGGSGQGVPTRWEEDRPAATWNLELEGGLIQPGCSVLAELGSLDQEAGVFRVARSFPASGTPMPLLVVPVPTVRIKLFPVRFGGAVGNLDQDGRTLADWLRDFRKLMPVAQVEVERGEVFEPEGVGGGEAALAKLAQALEVKRLVEDPWNQQFYVGVFRRPAAGKLNGQAWSRPGFANFGRAAICQDGAGFAGTLAHEMGHLFGLRHTPAGRPGGVDPDYPVADGTLDCAGYDLESREAKSPRGWADIMGYAERRWVSAYTWTRALDFLSRRLGPPSLAGPGQAPVAPKALLVAGTIAGDRVTWEPAFELPGNPDPPAVSPYHLVCLSRRGRILAQVPIQVEPVDATGGASFEVLQPLTGKLQRSLASFQLFKGDRRLTGIAGWTGLAPAPPARTHSPAREPSARKVGAGRVALDWDTAIFPGVLVLDAGTGRYCATLVPGSAEFPDPGVKELELLLSDGIRTTRVRVPVD